MYRIAKEFHFSAGHRLDHLPDEHPCNSDHGHNYVVQVGLSAVKLDDRGFILDYAELYPFKEYIDSKLDHKNLNVVLGSGYATTAENMARHLCEVASALLSDNFDVMNRLAAMRVRVEWVKVQETPKTMAVFMPMKQIQPGDIEGLLGAVRQGLEEGDHGDPE